MKRHGLFKAFIYFLFVASSAILVTGIGQLIVPDENAVINPEDRQILDKPIKSGLDCAKLSPDECALYKECKLTKPRKQKARCDWAILCSDSDNGLDYYKQGRTCIGESCNTDFCLDNSQINLQEFYCENGQVSKKEALCPESCKDGACAGPTVIYSKCEEDIKALKTTNFEGPCSFEVAEMFCPDDSNFRHTVPDGCGRNFLQQRGWKDKEENPPQICIDSDDGKEIYVAGKAYVGLRTQTDCCAKEQGMECSKEGDEKWVIEGACSDNEPTGYWIQCSDYCKDGACLKEPEKQECSKLSKTECLKNQNCVVVGKRKQPTKCVEKEPKEKGPLTPPPPPPPPRLSNFELCFKGDTFLVPEEACKNSLKDKNSEYCIVAGARYLSKEGCHVSYSCTVKCP